MKEASLKRFMQKIKVNGSCWEWTSTVTHRGYGMVTLKNKGQLAHRASFEHFNGPIPEGFHIDHLCRNKLCVNPKHLEAVTPKENILRGIGMAAQNKRKTHCVRGHEFNEQNSYKNKNDGRICRVCKRIASAAYKKRYPEKCNVYCPIKRRAKHLRAMAKKKLNHQLP